MFAVPFGRIFWKEYRVHRALWLSCLLIGSVIELVVWWLLIDLQSGASRPFAAILYLIPVMYAVGCGALLFAAEREERTSDWLLSLSPPPAAALTAKFAFAVASVLALQVTLGFIALAIMVSTLNFRETDVAMFFAPFGLIVLIPAILGSLMSRRVLVSVAAMVFWAAVSVLWPIVILRYWLGARWGVGWSWTLPLNSLFAAALLADIWIGWRWCQGRYFDGALIEELNARFQVWQKSLTRHAPVTTRLPGHAEYEQSWRRTWQRLVWQERHRESAHAFVLVFGCALGVTFSVIGGFDGRRITHLALMMNCAIPLVIGVIGFRSDISLQQPRFLANRGISPGSLWLAKQVVWLPRAFWISLVIFVVSLLSESWLGPEQKPFRGFYSQILDDPHMVIWLVMFGYGCGQLTAMLFRRVVLAFVIGIVLDILAIRWWSGMEILLVPLWWSLGIPLVAMLSITLWQMKPWLLEDRSRSRWWKLSSVLVAAPTLLISLLAWHRISEVSEPSRLNPNLTALWQASLASQLTPRSLSDDEQVVRNRLEAIGKADVVRVEPFADEIIDLMRHALSSMERQDGEQSLVNKMKLTRILTRAAAENMQSDQLDKALSCYLASLKLVRITSKLRGLDESGAWGTYCPSGLLEPLPQTGPWKMGEFYQRLILEDVVSWANHRSQTPASIRQAIRSVEAELAAFPSTSETVATSYLRSRRLWVLSSMSDAIKTMNQKQVPFDGLDAMVLRLPWERVRIDLTMTREAEDVFATIVSWEARLSSRDILESRIVTQGLVAKFTMSGSQHLKTFSSQVIQAVLDRQTMIRAALTRMELIAYRLEYGRFPETLTDLMPTLDGVQLFDPWSGNVFVYYPTFLLTAGNFGVSLVPTSATEFEVVTVPDLVATPDVIGERARAQQLMRSPASRLPRTMASLTDAKLVRGDDQPQWLFPIPPKPKTDLQR